MPTEATGSLKDEYHYEVNIDIATEFEAPAAPTEALTPIEGTTEKAEQALSMLNGSHLFRMDDTSKNGDGDYKLTERTYLDPDARSMVVETRNGDKISKIQGQKEDGDQGLIPFVIQNDVAVATGPSAERTYDDLFKFDVAPEALTLDADGNLVSARKSIRVP